MSNEEDKKSSRRNSNESVFKSENNVEQSADKAEGQLTDQSRVRRRSRRRKRRNQALVELEQIHHERRKKDVSSRTGKAKKRSKKARESSSEAKQSELKKCSGVLDIRKDGTGFLRQPDNDLAERKTDPVVPKEMVRRFALKNGSLILGEGFQGRGYDSMRLSQINLVDDQTIQSYRKNKSFKKRIVIDPDFHYELGDHQQEGQLSMRVLDLLCPIGRGQRSLLVAPPRTGKTTLLMNIANAMEALYPDVHLIVLLVDERPEEATYWKRNVKNGEVYVSTMDQSPKNHARLSELVQFRAERLVESGKEVVILLDSITRMTRAFNNVLGGKNSRTMSGGLDSKVFQRPKHFFGAARNTESGSSLTVIATALIDTGSKMDQVIFEEFKGTGNMELTLDRRLADRRVYPAVNIESTATRKEEKLLTPKTLSKVNILRRVLSRLRSREAMEMLADRLARYDSNREFLSAFSSDDL